MHGISLDNCYNAVVDWNGPPGYVDFWMNEKHQRVSAAPYRVCYNMGYDFRADNRGGRNILKAIAVNGNSRASNPAILHPMVFPLPLWAQSELFGLWALTPLARYVVYHSEIRFPSPEFEATVHLPSKLPVVGGDWGIKKTQIRGRFKAKSDGSGSSKLYGQTGFFAGSSSKEGRKREVVGFLSGQEKTQLSPGKGLRVTEATFSFGIKGAIKDKMGPTDLYPGLKAAENWFFVGWLFRKLNEALKLETAFEPQVFGTLFWKSIKEALQFDHGEVTGAVKIEVGISLELWKDKLKAALYGGGIPRLTFQAPANPSYLKEMGMKLYFGLKVIIWKFETRFQRGINCWYPPGSCKSSLAQAAALSQANWQLMSRAYVTENYAAFTANRSAQRLSQRMARPQTTEETEIVHNVFPLAEPDLDVRDNGQQMLTWVHDDPAKPNGQGEEIYFTFWNGTSWSAPAGITNDNKEDFAPQVTFDGSGHAVAVWERSNLVHPITPTLDITFTQSLEIAFSEWDGSGWSAPALLTSNNAMDYAPQLARDQDGKVMAIWFSNSGQTLVGDDDNPDSLYYAIWDGAAWSAPATAVATVTGTLDASLAYYGPQAVIVLSRDADGDPATGADSELFYTEWNGATWSALTRLTDDEVDDLAPQVVYNGAGQANVVWLKDDQLYYLAGGWAGTPSPLWPDGDALLASYRLTIDTGDNLALVYQALPEGGGADVYYTIYDQASGLWGQADRLTDDQPVEDYLTPVFASDGTLWIAYTKVETLFEDKEVEIEGETITVEGVPVPGRSDLYLLRHTIDQDLAISAEDIGFSVPNPAPGQTVVISATVHNTGDLAVTGGKARFYDGDPGLGGVQIAETQLLVSPLRAGITDTVSVEWTVPDTPTSHDIFVAVDPLQEIAESDEGNNVAYTATVLPDLLVSDLYVDHLPPQTVWITATVANSGTVPALDVRVEWHRDAITGTLLGAATVSEIAGGGSAEVGMTWTVSPADAGEHLVYAVVDPADAIAESDETNNSDLAAADVLPDLTLGGSYVEMENDDRPTDPLPITLVLSNQGVAEARDVRVRVVQGNPFANTSHVLYETVVPALEAGGEVVLTADISVPGWADVYAIADPERAIAELDEGNNLALLVEFPPRLFLPLISAAGR